MGYFPNSTDAEGYITKYCERCINSPDCPVFELQELWNYDVVGENKDLIKEEGLELFIPRKGVVNERCTMFHLKVETYTSWDIEA